MARNMVTRTVKGIKVAIKVIDTVTEQIVEDSVIISKGKKEFDADKLKKAVIKALPNGKILVAITGKEDVEKCYGIPTAKFMELAVELDPSSRSKVDAEEATEE